MSYQTATRADIAGMVRELFAAPRRLAHASVQLALTVVRLFHTYLLEEGVCEKHPISRGDSRMRGFVPRQHKLPWIPTEEQWVAMLNAVRVEPLRNRAMFALGYDAGLRREELCGLGTDDIDPAHRLLRVSAEHTKSRRERVVPYSPMASALYGQYLGVRRSLSRERGPLFLSESRRNFGAPISVWTWSKVVERLAVTASVPAFTTHALRHLCLTDLARADWDIHEIATFAGHRCIQTTLLYIHLSGRDLASKVANTLDHIHARRMALIAEQLK